MKYSPWQPNSDLIKNDKTDIFCEEFDEVTYDVARDDPEKALIMALSANEFEKTANLGYAIDWQNVVDQIGRCIGQCRNML